MKTKILVLVGIAVCALLLTSPVLASAGYSKIYGNANEDDILDMRDVTYIKLVIFGKKPETTLTDANYDGKISMLDVGQTKLIILGKEKELTLVDQADRTVTVPRPIERVASPSLDGIRAIVTFGEVDKLVGVWNGFAKYEHRHLLLPLRVCSELKELPQVGGTGSDVNIEVILSLKPDVIFFGAWTDVANADVIQEKTGIPVVAIKAMGSLDFEMHRLVGTVMEKEEVAEELISYAHEQISEITEVTSKIPEEEKQKVYLAFWTFQGTITRTPLCYNPVDLAGGINVAKGCAPTTSYATDVSKEQIIAWNPDIILIHTGSMPPKVPIDDVLSDSDLQTINAVKNRKVYYTRAYCHGWGPATGVTEVFYMAKLFYPEEFKDLDVEKECNEILERFYGIDGLYTEMSAHYDLYRWN